MIWEMGLRFWSLGEKDTEVEEEDKVEKEDSTCSIYSDARNESVHAGAFI